MFSVVSTLVVTHGLRDDLAGDALSCAHGQYVRRNVNQFARGISSAAQAGNTHRRSTLFGAMGLPDHVAKISASASVRLACRFPGVQQQPRGL